jgi:hypothetical protein
MYATFFFERQIYIINNNQVFAQDEQRPAKDKRAVYKQNIDENTKTDTT